MTISPPDSHPSSWGDQPRSPSPLDAEVIDSITGESERVGWAVSSTDGLTRVDQDEQRHVDVTVIAVITDEQFTFLSGPAAASGNATEAGSLAYDRLAATEIKDGVLVLTTVEGTEWRFSLGDAPPPVAEAVRRHVAWIGTVRGQVLACRNDVELAAGEIRDAADSMDWDVAERTYERVRARLDDAIQVVLQTTPISADVLAPELTRMARDLEQAYATLCLDRADSRLTLGQQLVGNEDHEQAQSVLRAAQTDFRRAESHAEAVQRGDDFVFGEQRALQSRLERLAWEIEAVAAEPLRQAHEAKIRARSTNDPDETVTQWETAFRRYGTVLALASGEGERHFAGDVAEIREDLGKAAGQLIAIHQTLARTEWDQGVQSHREDDVIETILRLDAAIDHLERAHEVASEFRPEAAPDMAARLDNMRAGLQRVREADAADRTREAADTPAPHTMGSGDEEATGDEPPTPAPEDITASELADIDTHQEITYTDEALASDRAGPTETTGDDWEFVSHRDDDG